jgi:hypothetical protein
MIIDIEQTDIGARVTLPATNPVKDWLKGQRFTWEQYGNEVVIEALSPAELTYVQVRWK